jgi:hypothetical protein
VAVLLGEEDSMVGCPVASRLHGGRVLVIAAVLADGMFDTVVRGVSLQVGSRE